MSQLTENIVEKGAAAIRAHFGERFPRTVLMLGSCAGGFAEKTGERHRLSPMRRFPAFILPR